MFRAVCQGFRPATLIGLSVGPLASYHRGEEAHDKEARGSEFRVCRRICSEMGYDECAVYKEVCQSQKAWDKIEKRVKEEEEYGRLLTWAARQVELEDAADKDARIHELIAKERLRLQESGAAQ